MSDDNDSREPTRLEKLMDQLTVKEQAVELGKKLAQGTTITDENQPRTPEGKKKDWEEGNREHRRVLPEEQGKGMSPATSHQQPVGQTSQVKTSDAAATQGKPADTLAKLKEQAKQIRREGEERQQQREANQKAEEPKREAPTQGKGGRGR